MSTLKIACFLCGSFAGSTFSDVVRHIGYVHACEPHFLVTCGLSGCKRQYRSFGAYRKHLYKAHGDVIKGNVVQVLENPCPRTSSSLGDVDGGGDIIADKGDNDSGGTIVDDVSVKRAAALFILKTAEKHKLPLSSMEGLMQDMQQLISSVLDRVATKSADMLSTEDTELLCGTLRDNSVVDPFIGLHSTYQQTKYYKEHLGLIEPVERVLGWKWQISSSNGHVSKTPDTSYDVPLLSSLQCLLKKSSVLEQIFNPHSLRDGLLGDYCDGEQFKSHPLFGCDPYALQIILYYDEVELCNPLGSYTKKHKLGLFYYLLGNIHPRLRAGLNTIQLLCAVKSQYVTEYGMDEILRPFVADILKLEKDEDVEFDTADGLKHFRGSLSVCSADNLASYELGGFKNLTGALRKCRICQATREDMSSKSSFSSVQGQRGRGRGRVRGRGKGVSRVGQSEMGSVRGRGRGRGRVRGCGRETWSQRARGRRGRGQRSGLESSEDEWSDTPTPVTVEPCTEPVGPTIPLSEDSLELFSLFFTDEVISLLVTDTNRYASQCLEAVGNGGSWSTSEEESRAYLGFYILMGMVREPEIRDYWSQDELLHYNPIASKISHKRFEEISRYLHFVDNSTLQLRGETGYHRLQKVKPLVTAVNQQFSEVYKPSSNVAVDEAMLPFKGRLCMKQYVPKKPVRRGFKIWVLADSCNGYFLDTDVYIGKAGDGVTTEHGLGGRVVLQLTEALAGKKYHIYCDNFFTSPDLFLELESRQLYACGTVRLDRRGIPDELKGVSLSRGECCFRQKGNLVATVWQDKRQVAMLSTQCDGDATKPVKRREKDGTEVCVDCPQCIITYNNHMAGVDRGDQMRQYYRKQQNLKKFRLALATKLVGSYNGRMRRGRPPLSLPRARPHPPSTDTPPAQRHRTAFHFPSHGRSRRCGYCGHFRTPPCRRESVWYCEDCEGCPTLCLTGCSNDCWRLWHT